MVPGYLSVKCHQHYISLYEQDALQSQVCLLSLTLCVCLYASFGVCLIKLFYILHKNCMENTDPFRIMCNAAFFAGRLMRQKKGGLKKMARKVPVSCKFRKSRGKTSKFIYTHLLC